MQFSWTKNGKYINGIQRFYLPVKHAKKKATFWPFSAFFCNFGCTAFRDKKSGHLIFLPEKVQCQNKPEDVCILRSSTQRIITRFLPKQLVHRECDEEVMLLIFVKYFLVNAGIVLKIPRSWIIS